VVELKPKPKVSGKQFSKPALTFFNPIFERLVTTKSTRDSKSKYIVSEWTVKLRCGHFFNVDQEEEVEEKYRPLQEGQVVKSLTVVPSGKFLNLVDFDLGEKEEGEPETETEGSPEEPSSKFILNPSYLVCLIETVYPIDQNALVELKKKLNQLSKVKKVKLEELEDRLLNFKFSNNLNLTFQQIGHGFHFLPISFVLRLFREGFEEFCTVHGLLFPGGEFVSFQPPLPHDYETLVSTLKQHGVIVSEQKTFGIQTKNEPTDKLHV
jgi:hypothetical protein